MAIQPFPIGLPTGIPIDALREQAKELLKSVQAGEPVALDKLRPIVQRMADAIERDEPDPAARRCSFCFKSQHQVPKFIAGTNVYICNECVDVGAGLVGGDEGQGEVQAGQEHAHCSFCDKPLGKVETIIAGPGTNICNECVELCVTIITEGTQADSS